MCIICSTKVVVGIWISKLHKSCHILPYKRLKYEKPPINLNHFLFFRWSMEICKKKCTKMVWRIPGASIQFVNTTSAHLYGNCRLSENRNLLQKNFLWPPPSDTVWHSYTHKTICNCQQSVHFINLISTFETTVNFTFQCKI